MSASHPSARLSRRQTTLAAGLFVLVLVAAAVLVSVLTRSSRSDEYPLHTVYRVPGFSPDGSERYAAGTIVVERAARGMGCTEFRRAITARLIHGHAGVIRDQERELPSGPSCQVDVSARGDAERLLRRATLLRSPDASRVVFCEFPEGETAECDAFLRAWEWTLSD